MDIDTMDTAEQSEKEEPTELTELFPSERKTVTLADTITLQAIICVVISIGYLAVNMLFPQISQTLYSEFKVNYNLETESAEDVFRAVSGFINSTPVDYD
ncbi:MAG: hypothetical protein LUI05_04650 [Oscillospiraceae bacterium]|nr:hypothetical protein [Oscillospiraceae bacterium]